MFILLSSQTSEDRRRIKWKKEGCKLNDEHSVEKKRCEGVMKGEQQEMEGTLKGNGEGL